MVKTTSRLYSEGSSLEPLVEQRRGMPTEVRGSQLGVAAFGMGFLGVLSWSGVSLGAVQILDALSGLPGVRFLKIVIDNRCQK